MSQVERVIYGQAKANLLPELRALLPSLRLAAGRTENCTFS